MRNIELVIPKLEEYSYEEKLKKDPNTMSYNAGYDVKYSGYHYDTGCIDFTVDKWKDAYDKRIKENRYFAYIKDFDINEYVVLDGRNSNKVKSVLNGANLIFLCGGNTLTQNNFLNRINLKKYLKKIDSVVVGISAGSINSVKNVFNSPESDTDLNNSPYLQGLELTNINIEPHFSVNNLNDNSKKIQMNTILSESNNRLLYGLTDGSYIIKNGSKCTLYGESYKIQNGNIIKICEDDNFIDIDDI
jgi:hypothetical protein